MACYLSPIREDSYQANWPAETSSMWNNNNDSSDTKAITRQVIVIKKIVILVVSLLIELIQKTLCNNNFKLKMHRWNQKVKG